MTEATTAAALTVRIEDILSESLFYAIRAHVYSEHLVAWTSDYVYMDPGSPEREAFDAVVHDVMRDLQPALDAMTQRGDRA